MQRLSPRPFRKRPASETETEGRIFFLEVSNETKWLLEPCGAYVKSISRQSYTSQVLQTFEKRCSPKPFGQTKNGMVSGRLARTSSKTEILNKIGT